jgi:hypothetical protein
MLYGPTSTIATPLSARSVTGCNIAHGCRDAVERALLAADWHLNRVTVTTPTIGKSATLFHTRAVTSPPASRSPTIPICAMPC